jgi:uncharacterized protein YutE (UPF0331/DUF86 family)
MIHMTKSRNVVVHNHEKIDALIEVTILKKHLDDFLLFREAILKQVPGGGSGVSL